MNPQTSHRRVLFISVATRGHVNPLIGVAQWLMKDGHQLAWLCMPSPGLVAAQLAASGIDAMGLPGVSSFNFGAGEEMSRVVRDRVAYAKRIRSVVVTNIEPNIEPIRQRIREFRPDVIVCDGQISAGVIASHLESVPFASLGSTLHLAEPADFASDFNEIMSELVSDRDAIFARYGLAANFASVEYVSPWLNVVFSTEALIGNVPLPPRTYLVGPSIPSAQRGDEVEFPWDKLATDRRIVYASFGSIISWQPDLFATIAEAAASLHVQLVLSAGELANTDFAAKLPANTLCVAYVPQMALLERTDAFITHGGANSIMETMFHGVPTLVIPMCRDQPLQGMFMSAPARG